MHAKHNSSLRIISGKWRSRKVYFPNKLAIRPTLDQIRETLFNWLDPYIIDSICLDLFAGSGVLAFEALSRGAKHATCFEKDSSVVKSLYENVDRFSTNDLEILMGDAFQLLSTLAGKYNIIFLDPPFKQNLLATGLSKLSQLDIFTQDAFIYFECEKDVDVSEICCGMEMFRHKETKNIQYGLLRPMGVNKVV